MIEILNNLVYVAGEKSMMTDEYIIASLLKRKNTSTIESYNTSVFNTSTKDNEHYMA